VIILMRVKLHLRDERTNVSLSVASARCVHPTGEQTAMRWWCFLAGWCLFGMQWEGSDSIATCGVLSPLDDSSEVHSKRVKK